MIATLRVRRPSGRPDVFLASRCEVDQGLVRALGRWKRYPEGSEREMAWPAGRVLEIRWGVVA